MGNLISQSVHIPNPPLTEKNCPDQTGKVHLITGGYTGVGLELAKILYLKNAILFVAGRSQIKYDAALAQLKEYAPDSQGRVSFIQIDLADLSTIKPAVENFLAHSDRLHVLTQNAGVMFAPSGTRSPQDEDLTYATNCTGPWLLYKLLRPTLSRTAKLPVSERGEVRVSWAGSVGIEYLSPQNGVVYENDKDDLPRPKVLNRYRNYGASKAGNLFFANEAAKADAADGIIHVSWNPGNCDTPLYRNMPTRAINSLLLYPAVYGAYTELFAAVSPDVTPAQSGAYVWPWGRFGSPGNHVIPSLKSESQGGNGFAERFVAWADRSVSPFL